MNLIFFARDSACISCLKSQLNCKYDLYRLYCQPLTLRPKTYYFSTSLRTSLALFSAKLSEFYPWFRLNFMISLLDYLGQPASPSSLIFDKGQQLTLKNWLWMNKIKFNWRAFMWSWSSKSDICARKKLKIERDSFLHAEIHVGLIATDSKIIQLGLSNNKSTLLL